MTDDDDESRSSPVRVLGGFDRGARAFLVAAFGIGGALVGVLVPWLAGLAADLPWVPFQGPVRLLGSFEDPWLVWGRPGIGAALGIGLAAWTILSTVVLSIGLDEIRVQRGGEVSRVIPREKVDSVYRERGKVVIVSETGRELFKDDVEGSTATIREAFVEAAYPWEGSPE